MASTTRTPKREPQTVMRILPNAWFIEEQKSSDDDSCSQAYVSPSISRVTTCWAGVFFLILIFTPTVILISRLVRGNHLEAGLGLAVSLPLSVFLLRQLHKRGVIGFAFSASLFVLASGVFWFVFANS